MYSSTFIRSITFLAKDANVLFEYINSVVYIDIELGVFKEDKVE